MINCYFVVKHIYKLLFKLLFPKCIFLFVFLFWAFLCVCFVLLGFLGWFFWFFLLCNLCGQKVLILLQGNSLLASKHLLGGHRIASYCHYEPCCSFIHNLELQTSSCSNINTFLFNRGLIFKFLKFFDSALGLLRFTKVQQNLSNAYVKRYVLQYVFHPSFCSIFSSDILLKLLGSCTVI